MTSKTDAQHDLRLRWYSHSHSFTYGWQDDFLRFFCFLQFVMFEPNMIDAFSNNETTNPSEIASLYLLLY